MANTTVIDSLIVKLGLDPRDFTKGEKQAAAETVKLENTVKKSSANMSKDFAGFLGKVAGLAGAAVLVKKFLSYNSDLSISIRQLGIDSANYKIAAAELRNFGNIAEMNGGKAEDATKTISGLSKAVYDLAYNGSMSDSLIMLGRLGIQFQDTTGNMRDFKSIVLDTQASVQNAMRNGTSRANAYQMLLQAGFDPGLANAMLKGDVSEQLARQQQRRQVSGSDVALATKWEQSAANRSQALDAAALRQLAVEAVPGTIANNAIAATADAAGTATVESTSKALSGAFESATGAVTSFAHRLMDAAEDSRLKALPRGRKAYESDIQGAAKRYGLDPEILAGILKTESNFDPTAVSSTGRKGIAQLTPAYFPGAGNNPHADIYTAAKEFVRLKQKHLNAGNDDAAASYLALEDYNAGARGAAEMRSGKRSYTSETAAYPGKVLGYATQATPSPGTQVAGGSNSRTDITFEKVEVNTNGRNGEAIADDFVNATRRKMQAAQAETGGQ